MKKICVLLVSVFLFFAGNAFAATIEIDVFNTATDTVDINDWRTALGGNDVLIEDFETTTLGWYTNLGTNVGTFTAGGSIGLGGSSYNALNNPDSNDPWFRISDQEVYGRDTKDNFLDSADITKLTLDVTPDLTNVWFYIQDPSDQGATTTITAETSFGVSNTFVFNNQANAAEFFVGISIDGNDTLKQIVWETSGTNLQKDGYGLDNFTTVSAVPIPGAALLLASGLLGLGWVKKRSKELRA